MDQLKKFFSTIFRHKLKFVLMLFSALVFAFLLFPFDDLGDLVTAQVAKLTNEQVYVQFDRMNVGILDPGLQLKNVYFETKNFAPLSANEITLTPSLMGLITQKPAGSITARGLFKGDVEISLKNAGKSDAGVERQKITLNARKLSLEELKDIANLPLVLKGRVDVTSTANADLTFQEQPDMDLSVRIEKFELPTGNVESPMGPLTVPELKLQTVELKGRLSAGRFQIEEGVIGKVGDDLRGTIKGGLDLQLRSGPQGIIPVIGRYDFSVDLTVTRSLQERATFFLSLLDSYKTATPDGAHYRFKVSADGPFVPPQIGAVR